MGFCFGEGIHDSIRSRGRCAPGWCWRKQSSPDTISGNERWMGQNSDQFPLPVHCPRDVRSQGLFPFPGCPLFCPPPLHSLPCSHWDLSRMHHVPPLLKTLQCSPLEFWITAPTQGFPCTPTSSHLLTKTLIHCPLATLHVHPAIRELSKAALCLGHSPYPVLVQDWSSLTSSGPSDKRSQGILASLCCTQHSRGMII